MRLSAGHFALDWLAHNCGGIGQPIDGGQGFSFKGEGSHIRPLR